MAQKRADRIQELETLVAGLERDNTLLVNRLAAVSTTNRKVTAVVSGLRVTTRLSVEGKQIPMSGPDGTQTGSRDQVPISPTPIMAFLSGKGPPTTHGTLKLTINRRTASRRFVLVTDALASKEFRFTRSEFGLQEE